jgi:tetratricopeptide (TPR) repeat protein
MSPGKPTAQRPKRKRQRAERQPRRDQEAAPQRAAPEPAPEATPLTRAGIPLEQLPDQRATRGLRQAAVLQLQQRHGNVYVRGVLAGRAAGRQGSGPVQRQAPAVQEALLQLGSAGPAVEELQRLLNAAGARPPLVVDGDFGPATRAAVIWFQRAHGLDPDGMVGPQTGTVLYGREGAGEEAGTPDELVESNIVGSETPQEEYEKGKPKSIALYEAGRYAEALAFFKRFYGLPELEDKRHHMAWNMGMCHVRLGQRDQAVIMFQEYLLFPIPEAKRQRALEWIRRARTGEVPPPGQEPPEVTPEQQAAADAEAEKEIALGKAAGLAGQYEKARQHMWNAYSLRGASNENRWWAAIHIARASQHLGEFDKAIDFYQEALGFPGTSDTWRLKLLERIRQCRKGQVERTEPPRPMTYEELWARYQAGAAALDQGQYAAALAIFQEIYENPDAPPERRRSMAYNMGICHQRLQQFGRAIAMFEESLLFPGVPPEKQRATRERIRQCRQGEIGPHLRPTGPAEGLPAGAPRVLFNGMVYFETGRADVGSIGQETVRQLGRLLKERHNAEPGLAFLVELVGGASSRWRGAGSDEQARKLNEELSRRRAANVEKALRGELPPADVAAGVYRFDPEAEGDRLSETMGLDPDDNTWTLRNVALTVWASGASSA